MAGLGLIALILGFGAMAFIDSGESAFAEPDTDDPVTDPPSEDPPADTPTEPGGVADDPAPSTGDGGAGDDVLLAEADASSLSGFAGDDTLIGMPEFSTMLDGGAGDDTLVLLDNDEGRGGAGDDQLIADQLNGDNAPQVMDGGDGADTLITSGGAVLSGGDGSDTFVVAPGGIDADGNFESITGAPLDAPLVRDFDLDEDRLIIDFERSFHGQFDEMAAAELDFPAGARSPLPFDESVTLSATRSADGQGVLILAKGITMAELEGFQDMDPDQVLAEMDVNVIGATVRV